MAKTDSPAAIIGKWYQEKKDRKELMEKNKHLTCADFLNIGLDFLECKDVIQTNFPGVKGFMFSKKQLLFVVDDSVNEDQKAAIREACVGFVELRKILNSVNKTAQQKP